MKKSVRYRDVRQRPRNGDRVACGGSEDVGVVVSGWPHGRGHQVAVRWKHGTMIHPMGELLVESGEQVTLTGQVDTDGGGVGTGEGDGT